MVSNSCHVGGNETSKKQMDKSYKLQEPWVSEILWFYTFMY